MAEGVEILGIYDRATTAAVGVRAVLEEGLGEVITYSPVPDRALDQALHVTLSPVRLFVLINSSMATLARYLATPPSMVMVKDAQIVAVMTDMIVKTLTPEGEG